MWGIVGVHSLLFQDFYSFVLFSGKVGMERLVASIWLQQEVFLENLDWHALKMFEFVLDNLGDRHLRQNKSHVEQLRFW